MIRPTAPAFTGRLSVARFGDSCPGSTTRVSLHRYLLSMQVPVRLVASLGHRSPRRCQRDPFTPGLAPGVRT